MITNIGIGVVTIARAVRELWLVYVGAVAGIWRGKLRGQIAPHLFNIGNKSFVFIVVTLGFIGMVMTYEGCLQLTRLQIADFSQVGQQLLRLLISDFAPTLTAMMLATRVGAGIAA